MRRFILPLLALAIVVGPPLAYARFRAFHYRNFRVVAADRLYRSGQLSPYGLSRVWHEFGIGTVVTLREDDELKGTAGGDWEARWCKEHEVAFVRLPPQRWHVKGQGPVPAQANVDRFLEVLTNPDRYPRPVLMHCFKGTHRTGVFVALYRMEIEGWTNEEAIAELMSLGYDNLEEEPDVYDYLRNYRPKRNSTPRAGGVSPLSEAAGRMYPLFDFDDSEPEVQLRYVVNTEGEPSTKTEIRIIGNTLAPTKTESVVQGFNVNNRTLTPITREDTPATPRAGGVSPLSEAAGKSKPQPIRQASFEVKADSNPIFIAGIQCREIQLPLERELPTISQHGRMHLKRWIVVVNSTTATRGLLRGLNHVRDRDTIELLDTLRHRSPETVMFMNGTSITLAGHIQAPVEVERMTNAYFVVELHADGSSEPRVTLDELLTKLIHRTHATWSPNQPFRESKPFQEPAITLRVHPPTWVLGPDLKAPDDLNTFLAEIEDLTALRFFRGEEYLCSFTLHHPIDLENWSLGTLILAFPFVGMNSGSPTADPRELLVKQWIAVRGQVGGMSPNKSRPPLPTPWECEGREQPTFWF